MRFPGLRAMVVMTCLVAAVPGPFRGVRAQAPQASATDPNTGLIVGRVVEGLTDRPLAGVIVRLVGTGPGRPTTAPRAVVVDGDGRFVFSGLAAGSYTVELTDVNMATALDGGYGLRRPGGTQEPIPLAAGERKGDVTLRAWRPASASGTVTDEHGDPVVETRVSALRVVYLAGHRRYQPGPSAVTDDRGMFRIPALEPGEYTLYVAFEEVTLPESFLAAAEAASGQAARNAFERSLPGIDTSLLATTGVRVGDEMLVRESTMVGPDGMRGPHFTSPTPDAAGHALVYPFTYLPNATSLASAATIRLESGEARGELNLQIRLVPGVRVSGHVQAVDGPGATVGVRLVPVTAADAANESVLEAASSVTSADGDFVFLGVPAGQYILKIARVPDNERPQTMTSVTVGGLTMFTSAVSNEPPLPIPDTPTWSASMPVTVGGHDLTGLAVTLSTGARLSGHLEYAGTSAPLTADQLLRATITLEPADGRSFTGAINKGQFDAQGRFRTMGLVPGRYRLRVGGNLGPWTLFSAVTNGHDLADGGLTVETTDISDVIITLTDRQSALSGTVRDTAGAPDGTAAVLVFPADRESWADEGASPRRMRVARASSLGVYRLTGLPPGDYLAIAVDDGLTENWQDPKRLDEFATRATRLTITAGDQHGLDLKTVTLR